MNSWIKKESGLWQYVGDTWPPQRVPNYKMIQFIKKYRTGKLAEKLIKIYQ